MCMGEDAHGVQFCRLRMFHPAKQLQTFRSPPIIGRNRRQQYVNQYNINRMPYGVYETTIKPV